MKRTNEQIAQSIKEQGFISEKDINLLKNRANSGDLSGMQLIYDNEVEVSAVQVEKGFTWLWDQYKTPRGVERKNNPFGYREQSVLEGVGVSFTFDDIYDTGNSVFSFYVPVYTISSSGGSFQYYVSGGKVHIIG